MSGKANGVFWIGLILIFLNFWLSGQSTTVWSHLTLKAGSSPGSGGSGFAVNPNAFNQYSAKKHKGPGAIGK